MKTDFNKLNNLIACSDWSQLKYCNNLEDVIYETINSLFEDCVPLVTPISSVKPPCFSKELTHLKNVRSEQNL